MQEIAWKVMEMFLDKPAYGGSNLWGLFVGFGFRVHCPPLQSFAYRPHHLNSNTGQLVRYSSLG